MNKLHIEKKERNAKEYLAKKVHPSHVNINVAEDTLVLINDEPALLYMKVAGDAWAKARKVLAGTNYYTGMRMNMAEGNVLKSRSKVFGYRPRMALRKNTCSAAAWAFDRPEEHEALCQLSGGLSQIYEEYFPARAAAHREVMTEKIKKEWVMGESMFTSGIANKDNPLPYHFDTGTFKEILSAMIVFREKTLGGELCIPPYDMRINCADSTVVLFDGHKEFHGVTPIKHVGEGAFRCSAVFYALRDMWRCETLISELDRVRFLKQEKEKGRKKKP